MDCDKNKYFIIEEFEFIDIERSIKKSHYKGFHKDFIESLGLKFISYVVINNYYYYKFEIINNNKWFLSRIKYGF